MHLFSISLFLSLMLLPVIFLAIFDHNTRGISNSHSSFFSFRAKTTNIPFRNSGHGIIDIRANPPPPPPPPPSKYLTHTRTHTHTHSHACVRMRTHTHIHKNTHSHAHTRAYTYTKTHTHMHTRVRACPHTHKNTHSHACTCTHTHTHTKHTLTCTHTHTHTQNSCLKLSWLSLWHQGKWEDPESDFSLTDYTFNNTKTPTQTCFSITN